MPSKYRIILEMASQTARDIASNADRYTDFLITAANNYKYSFKEQLLIHAQKPDATACAEIDTWNKLGRWVNKGTKGIALLIDRDVPYKLRHVFDISDTNSRAGRNITLWQMKPEYEYAVSESLQASFGDVEEPRDFPHLLIDISGYAVEDNLSDYLMELNAVKAGSFLEELDDTSLEAWLKTTLKSSVAFMALSRAGYEPRQYFDREDFSHLFDFNTVEVISVLGAAVSDISEMVIREMGETVKEMEKEERRKIRTFAQEGASKIAPHVLHPEINTEYRTNFQIESDDIGVGTPLERFYHNIRAIQLLNKLDAESRLATPTEQRVLADYVGWGGLSEFFKEDNPHYTELKAVLSDEEYASARESTLTAFYTPPVVIKAVYSALENMHFQTGNVLEPSCGIGNFMGLVPGSMNSAKFYGVELDSISGRIAQQLYQKNSIAVQGFENTNLPDSFFDAAIGNVPFGQFKVPDKRYDKQNFLIHDYFFARTLDKVRPGGVIAFITSKGTLDKENSNVRKYIAQRADLLGAIRLPNDTFKAAAGTEVTSDIIFLQKRDRLVDIEPDWVHLATDANGIRMNAYFVDNPEMVLGDMQMVSGPHGMESACTAYENAELGDLLRDAIQNIHAEITEYEIDDLEAEDESLSIPADPDVRNFSFTVVDGKIYYRENSRMNPVDVSTTAENRIKGMIAIRDCVRTLIEYQTENYPDADIKAEQEKLNRLYDDFSKKYGLINARANNSAFNSDSSYCLLSSLEVLDDEGNFIRKADMFSKRTIKQKVTVQSVDTASEAYALSLAEKARIDMPYMSQLTGKTEQELFEDLKGVIFLNPMHISEEDGKPKYLPADEYLSGNVREKLRWAKRSAELYPEDYGENIRALEAVQPVDLTASEISVRLGATWLPPEIIEEFMFELFSTPRYCQWNIHVHYAQYTGEWNVEGKSYDRSNVKAHNTYGTGRVNGYKIMEETLNLRDVRIFDYIEDGNGRKTAVLNKKETAIAQGKQELIKQAFADWIWSDPERREQLTKLYNEKFNSIRPREYDGSHLNFVGINPEITLRPHQVNAIAHILFGGGSAGHPILIRQDLKAEISDREIHLMAKHIQIQKQTVHQNGGHLPEFILQRACTLKGIKDHLCAPVIGGSLQCPASLQCHHSHNHCLTGKRILTFVICQDHHEGHAGITVQRSGQGDLPVPAVIGGVCHHGTRLRLHIPGTLLLQIVPQLRVGCDLLAGGDSHTGQADKEQCKTQGYCSFHSNIHFFTLSINGKRPPKAACSGYSGLYGPGQSGIVPCLRSGVPSALPASIYRAAHRRARSSSGAITSSISPLSAAARGVAYSSRHWASTVSRGVSVLTLSFQTKATADSGGRTLMTASGRARARSAPRAREPRRVKAAPYAFPVTQVTLAVVEAR